MTPDELKAELAQLAEENGRLREALEICASENADLVPSPYYKSLTIGRKSALEALQTPPTPGLGAAMVRAVEAVNSDIVNYGDSCVPKKTLEAVQALNELEGK